MVVPKIKIEIFIPSGKCLCSYSKWIENIWNKLENYRDFIDVDTMDTNCQRAKDLGISSQALIVNNENVLVFYLQDHLRALINSFEK